MAKSKRLTGAELLDAMDDAGENLSTNGYAQVCGYVDEEGAPLKQEFVIAWTQAAADSAGVSVEEYVTAFEEAIEEKKAESAINDRLESALKEQGVERDDPMESVSDDTCNFAIASGLMMLKDLGLLINPDFQIPTEEEHSTKLRVTEWVRTYRRLMQHSHGIFVVNLCRHITIAYYSYIGPSSIPLDERFEIFSKSWNQLEIAINGADKTSVDLVDELQAKSDEYHDAVGRVLANVIRTESHNRYTDDNWGRPQEFKDDETYISEQLAWMARGSQPYLVDAAAICSAGLVSGIGSRRISFNTQPQKILSEMMKYVEALENAWPKDKRPEGKW
jgi:hypothetical protein